MIFQSSNLSAKISIYFSISHPGFRNGDISDGKEPYSEVLWGPEADFAEQAIYGVVLRDSQAISLHDVLSQGCDFRGSQGAFFLSIFTALA